jgi:multicomponent Na+:H+ antiporter subunit D
MMQFLEPNTFIILPLLIGALNLLTPFITTEDSSIRSFFLITFSLFFLASVLVLDYLFFYGWQYNCTLLDIGKFSISIHLEPVGLVFLSLIAVLWVCALLYTIKFLAINEIKSSNRFLFFMNACILTGCLIALSANLLTMFIGYEILTLLTVPLIAHYSNQKTSEAIYKYLKILMISSIVLFLPAIIFIYNAAGHGDFKAGGFLSGYFEHSTAIILLLMMIFGIAKAAIFPLHGWLPTAMIAIYPASAILHAVVVVKTGLFCIYKIMLYVFGLTYLQELFQDYNWLIYFPIITIAYSSVKAISCRQIKTILAYSTMNQLSISLLSAFMLSEKGLIAAIIHMVSHSFTKICLFYSTGNIFSVKSSYTINELIGTKTTMPKTGFFMVISGLSLIGLPPFAGFISKFYILTAAADLDNFLVIATILISSLFSATYVLKILIFIYKPTDKEFISHIKLKHYFDEAIKSKRIKKLVGLNNRVEKILPSFMIISIILCMLCVVGFFFIQQLLQEFLVLI